MPVDYDLGTARGRIVIDSSQLGRASQAMRTFGLVTTAAGLAAAAGFVYVVKAAADFEKQMDAVKAVSGASRAEMKLLSEQALDLSTRTVFSAGEIGGAMEALAKAGIPVQDMLDGATQATINLAAAAGDELPGGVQRAAEIIANAQKTFNASAEDMEHFADVLVGAAASSTLSVEDLAVSMRYAGPIAASLGLTIDDLSTTLAILGDRGIRGSTAGTSLRGVLISLQPSSKKAADAMKELGIITEDGSNRFFDLQGNLKPMPEIMEILGDATKNLSEQEKVAAFNAIFQRRAMNAAMILAEQGEAGFRKYAEAIGAIDAADVAAEKLDNLSGDMTILRNSIETLIIRAGQPLQEFFRKIVQGLTNFVQKLNEVDPQILGIIVTILGIVGVLLTFIGVVALAGSAAIRAYRIFKDLRDAITLLAGAFRLLSVSFLLNPITLVIAAIALIAGAIWLAYQRSETFRKAWDQLFEDLRPIFEAIGRFVVNFVEQLKNLWEVFREGDDVAQGAAEVIDNMFGNTGKLVPIVRGLINGLIDLWHAAVQAFDYFANVVLPTIIDVGYAIVNGIGVAIDWLINTGIPAIVDFGTAVADVATAFASWFNENVMPTLSAFAELAVAVFGRVQGAVEVLWPIFQAVWANIIIVVKTAIAVLAAIIGGFIAAVMILWNNFGSILWNTLVTAFNLIKGIVEGALQSIRGIIQIITGIITLDWRTVWEGIKNFFLGQWTAIKAIVSAALAFIQLIIQTFLAIVKSIWQLTWNGIKTAVQVVWALIRGIIQAALNTIRGFIGAQLNAIRALWESIWNRVRGFVQTAWNLIKTIVSSAISVVVGFVAAIPGRIAGALSSLLSTLQRLFVNAFNSAKTAVTNGISGILNLIRTIPGKIISALGHLGSLLFSSGRSLIQGFIDGIKSMIGSIGDALGSVKDSIPSWVDGPLGIFSPSKFMMWRGEMLMKGLQEGIKKEMGPLGRVMRQIQPTVGDFGGTGAFGAAAVNGSRPATVNLTLEFPSVTNAAEARQIERELGTSSVLSQIIHATRAGVGAR